MAVLLIITPHLHVFACDLVTAAITLFCSIASGCNRLDQVLIVDDSQNKSNSVVRNPHLNAGRFYSLQLEQTVISFSAELCNGNEERRYLFLTTRHKIHGKREVFYMYVN